MNINWQQVTQNLRFHYKSVSKLARASDISWQTLERLANGNVKQPRFDTGIKLLDFHFDTFGADKHKSLLTACK